MTIAHITTKYATNITLYLFVCLALSDIIRLVLQMMIMKRATQKEFCSTLIPIRDHKDENDRMQNMCFTYGVISLMGYKPP